MKSRALLPLTPLITLAALLPARADLVSQTALAVDTAVVSTTADASVLFTPRTDLIAGLYAPSAVLGTWQASVTEGAVAYRINREINPALSSSPAIGTGLATNRDSSNATLPVTLIRNSSGAETLSGQSSGWLTLASGVSTAGGEVRISSTGSGSYMVSPGRYPIGIDVVAWSN